MKVVGILILIALAVAGRCVVCYLVLYIMYIISVFSLRMYFNINSYLECVTK